MLVKTNLKPFIKWIGSKQQNLKHYKDKYPVNIQELDTYVEPFLGGGAIFFYVLNTYPNIKNFYLSDLNKELINVWKCIQEDAIEVYTHLNDLNKEYLSYDQEQKKALFKKIRIEYNNSLLCKEEKEILDRVVEAANFIFLNKTCFNGIYRVNQTKGTFNVPWNGVLKPKFPDLETFQQLQYRFQRINFEASDFRDSLKYITDKTLLYIDSPYTPVTDTSFTSYTRKGFNMDLQEALAEYVKEASLLKAKVMTANSCHADNLKLYEGFNFIELNVKRSINSNGDNRTGIEYLITNY